MTSFSSQDRVAAITSSFAGKASFYLKPGMADNPIEGLFDPAAQGDLRDAGRPRADSSPENKKSTGFPVLFVCCVILGFGFTSSRATTRGFPCSRACAG